MNEELPPFKNGEYNSKNVSTLDCGLTPVTSVAIRWQNVMVHANIVSTSTAISLETTHHI